MKGLNTVVHAGFLKEGASAYTRVPGEELLLFTLYVPDPETGEPVPHKYRVERPDLMRDYRPFLTPGRQMTITGKSKLAPVIKHGVTKFETTVFEALHIVFHSRAGAMARPASGSDGIDQHEEGAGAERIPAPAPEAGDAEASEAPLARALKLLTASRGAGDDIGVRLGLENESAAGGGAESSSTALPAA